MMRDVEPLPTSEAAHTLVLPFDVDLGAMDSRARAGLEFLFEELRRRFFSPALQTSSSDEFVELWKSQGQWVLELVRSINTLAQHVAGAPSERAMTQLVNGDRRVADELALTMDDVGCKELAERLRTANILVSRARACAAETFADQRSVVDWLSDYVTGNLVWSVGIMGLIELREAWLPSYQPRLDLLDDFVEIVEAGAVEAGVNALLLRDLRFDPDDDDDLFEATSEPPVVSFLLEALRRVREHFGPEATVTIAHFYEPDFEGPPSRHFCIETALPPKQACDAYERFCVGWWEDAVAEIVVVIHPILEMAR